MMGAIGEGVGGDEKIMDQETTWLTLLWGRWWRWCSKNSDQHQPKPCGSPLVFPSWLQPSHGQRRKPGSETLHENTGTFLAVETTRCAVKQTHLKQLHRAVQWRKFKSLELQGAWGHARVMSEIELSEQRHGTCDLTKSHLHVQLQDGSMLHHKELLERDNGTPVCTKFGESNLFDNWVNGRERKAGAVAGWLVLFIANLVEVEVEMEGLLKHHALRMAQGTL